MKRNDFLNILRQKLNSLGSKNTNEIVSDFEEHFIVGAEQGKTDDEISRDLGDPIEIAGQFCENDETISEEKKKTIIEKTPAIIGLFCLNFFLVIWLFVSIYAVVFSVWVSAGSMVLAGFLSSMASVLHGALKEYIFLGMHPVLAFLSGLIVAVIGLLGVNLSIYITKWTVVITKKYIKWNMDIINK